jgi:WD40 repeat protein
VVLVLRGHEAAVTCAVFSDDGNQIVSGSQDNTACVWDSCTGGLIGQLKGHTAAITSACFSPDGRRVITGSSDSTAKLWDAQTAKEILTLKAHNEEVTSVDFSDDGRYVVTGSRDGTAIVWLTEEWRAGPQLTTGVAADATAGLSSSRETSNGGLQKL